MRVVYECISPNPLRAVCILLPRHADNKNAIFLRHAPRPRDGEDVAPRVERVAIASKAAVLHRGEGDDGIEGTKCTVRTRRAELRRRQRREQWVIRCDRSVLECDDGSGARGEADRFNPRTLGANDEHALAGEIGV